MEKWNTAQADTKLSAPDFAAPVIHPFFRKLMGLFSEKGVDISVRSCNNIGNDTGKDTGIVTGKPLG